MRLSALMILCIITRLTGQQDFIAQQNPAEEEVRFVSAGDTLYGKLILPKKTGGKFPVVVFIHGSGPEDYSSSGMYQPLFEKFNEAGFACFSWDRPGVGRSQGKWYEKSIADRAMDAVQAVERLKRHPRVSPGKIGYWGLSQAGWVIHRAAEIVPPAFVISVSAPVTTVFEQEANRLRTELARNGYPGTTIDSAMAYISEVRKLALEDKPFGDFEDLQTRAKQHRWSSHLIMGGEPVYQYLKVLLAEDRAPDLASLTCPLLAIWGENDLLVPARPSAGHYIKAMKETGNLQAQVVVLPDADHTLTFNTSGSREETIKRREAYKEEPERIFAPGYLDLMIRFLAESGLANRDR